MPSWARQPGSLITSWCCVKQVSTFFFAERICSNTYYTVKKWAVSLLAGSSRKTPDSTPLPALRPHRQRFLHDNFLFQCQCRSCTTEVDFFRCVLSLSHYRSARAHFLHINSIGFWLMGSASLLLYFYLTARLQGPSLPLLPTTTASQWRLQGPGRWARTGQKATAWHSLLRSQAGEQFSQPTANRQREGHTCRLVYWPKVACSRHCTASA